MNENLDGVVARSWAGLAHISFSQSWANKRVKTLAKIKTLVKDYTKMKKGKSILMGFVLLFGVMACSKQGDQVTVRNAVILAPHGGTLIFLGGGKYGLEFVLNRPDGELMIYTLDSGGKSLPTGNEGFEVRAEVAGQGQTLILAPLANTAAGELAGSTSRYRGQSDWLKSSEAIHGAVMEVYFRNSKYTEVKFEISAGK